MVFKIILQKIHDLFTNFGKALQEALSRCYGVIFWAAVFENSVVTRSS